MYLQTYFIFIRSGILVPAELNWNTLIFKIQYKDGEIKIKVFVEFFFGTLVRAFIARPIIIFEAWPRRYDREHVPAQSSQADKLQYVSGHERNIESREQD